MEPISFRNEGPRIVAEGYAAKFERDSQVLGNFVERIAPGAFKKTIKEADVRALFNHDPSLLLGRNKAGTLRMEEDSTGLRYEVDLPDTTVGRDVAVLLERGDITGSSFGFRVISDDWDYDARDDGLPQRTLREVALVDVSPVTYPAYLDTDSGLRSLAESRGLDLDMVMSAAENHSLQDLLARSLELASDETPAAEGDAQESQAEPTPLPHDYRQDYERKLKELGL